MTGLVEGIAAVASASAAVVAYGVRVPSSSLLAPSVHRGVTTRRSIALTFDDGPSESTPELLELLARYSAPVTFFQCGANVRRLPEIARLVAASGHEIGNHTDTHPLLALKDRAFIYREMAAAQQSIEQVAGTRPRLFRAPYGVRWFGLAAVQRTLALTGVTWTSLALDWKLPSDRVVARLLPAASNGAILCLHDGRALQSGPDIRVTIEAVRELLPKLMEQGFHFEKVTDILCPTKN